MENKYTRDHFLASMSVGNIVAFEINDQMQTGKVVAIDGNKVTIKTKNCSIYYITKGEIKWVKTGSNWPTGIYNAIKFRHA